MKRQNLQQLNDRLAPFDRSIERKGRSYLLHTPTVDVPPIPIANLTEATEIVNEVIRRLEHP